jgi:hypothetical protein
VAFIGIVIAWIATYVAQQLLRAVTFRPENQKPGHIEPPAPQEGATIPAIFGTVKLAPNIVALPDDPPREVPVKKRIQTSIFTTRKQTVAHKYLVTMQGVLCWGPVDELVDIVLADKYSMAGGAGVVNYRENVGPGDITVVINAAGIAPSLPQAYAAGGTALTLDAPFLYGGRDGEGGVTGTLRFYFGSATQNANAYLVTKVADPFPAYRGLCYAVWEHVNCGQNPYLKNWHFVLRRCPTTLGTLAGDVTLSRIGNDANPAEVLYELWTDARWGMGRRASELDIPSFIAALETLADEELGISGSHGESGQADAKAAEIRRHIDATFGPDPATGLMRLKLIRDDYDVATLPVFNTSNTSRVNVARPPLGEKTTQVKVNYTDAGAGFTTRTRQAHNPAVERAQGYAIGAVANYPLLTTGANAERVAARDCRTVSATLAAGSIVATRAAARLAPGEPFIIDFPDDGFPMVVVRATRSKYGSIHSTEDVEIQLTEDVFASSGGVFVTTPPDVWEPPPPTAFPNLVVTPVLTLDATQGCVKLVIEGRVESIVSIEMTRQKGGEAAEAPVAFDADDPPQLCVDRDDIETGRIAWVVTFTQADGTEDTEEGEEAIPPLGADDGNADGTPGNWSHAFITEYGGTAVLGAHGTAAEDLPCGLYRRFLKPGSFLRGQATVVVAGAITAFLDLKVSLDGGDTWETDSVGIRVPLRDVKHAVGFAIEVPEDFEGDVLLKAVVEGGNDVAVPELLNFIIESTSAEPPPADGEDEPVTPGVPTDGLVAYWALTEGSGSSVASKDPAPSGPSLTLGFTTGTESDARFDPSWQTGPRRLRPAGFDLVYSAFSHLANIPSYAAGSACFMYVDVTTFGGLAKFFMGIGNSPFTYRMGVDGSNKLFAQISEDSGGDPVRTATGTTTISNGSKHLVGFIHDGTNLNVYVDPEDGLPEGTVACATAKFDATTDLIIGGGAYPPGAGQPDNFDHGDVVYASGAGVASWTPDDIAGLFAWFKLTYPALS